jgi:hypothetical protein
MIEDLLSTSYSINYTLEAKPVTGWSTLLPNIPFSIKSSARRNFFSPKSVFEYYHLFLLWMI